MGEGQEELSNATKSGAGAEENGWQLTLHLFDYNIDFFEIGTVDDENFKITDPTQRIIARAVAAKAGLWGNHAYEAAYAMIYTDSTGQQLTGANTYILRLDPTPPVHAFWSITMYSTPDFYLCANPIDRYSIGDRTPASSTTTTAGSRSPSATPSPSTPKPAPTGSPPRTATSAPACACTSPSRQSSTRPTSSPDHQDLTYSSSRLARSSTSPSVGGLAGWWLKHSGVASLRNARPSVAP